MPQEQRRVIVDATRNPPEFARAEAKAASAGGQLRPPDQTFARMMGWIEELGVAWRNGRGHRMERR
jgi:hypothetical protein